MSDTFDNLKTERYVFCWKRNGGVEVPVRRRGMCALLVMATLSVVSCAGERESPPFVSSERLFEFTGRNVGPVTVPPLPSDRHESEAAPYGAITLSGGWSGAANVSLPGSVTCFEHNWADSVPAGHRQWAYEVHTSSFYEYDGGGEYPGRDFQLQVYVNEKPEPGQHGSAIMKFSDQSGQFVSFGGGDDKSIEIVSSPDRRRVALSWREGRHGPANNRRRPYCPHRSVARPSSADDLGFHGLLSMKMPAPKRSRDRHFS